MSAPQMERLARRVSFFVFARENKKREPTPRLRCKRIGFRAVFADGHGPSRREWVRELKRRQDHFALKLFGVTTELLTQWKFQTDHAARNETSLMLRYRPELVDVSRLPQSRANWPVGVRRGGEDPGDASAEHGRECMEASLAVMIKMFLDAGI